MHSFSLLLEKRVLNRQKRNLWVCKNLCKIRRGVFRHGVSIENSVMSWLSHHKTSKLGKTFHIVWNITQNRKYNTVMHSKHLQEKAISISGAGMKNSIRNLFYAYFNYRKLFARKVYVVCCRAFLIHSPSKNRIKSGWHFINLLISIELRYDVMMTKSTQAGKT